MVELGIRGRQETTVTSANVATNVGSGKVKAFDEREKALGWNLLLSHDPTHWEMEVIGKDIPLMLSGHTHAIQFSLFGWCPSRYLFRQYRGLYSEGGQSLYVNIGLGETIFPARIGARPEITLISLKKP